VWGLSDKKRLWITSLALFLYQVENKLMDKIKTIKLKSRKVKIKGAYYKYAFVYLGKCDSRGRLKRPVKILAS